MKFYDRVAELEELKRIRQLAFDRYSRMTVITGRRRIGKTSLALIATRGEEPTIYLFVGRKSEAELCREFSGLITSAIGGFIPAEIQSFGSLFRIIMEMGRTRRFNLIIDEFQEWFNINKSIYSDIQNYWDQLRGETHINLILMGSVYSMMHRIFEDYHQPLFGRSDNMIRLQGFGTDTLREIMVEHRPGYNNDELLALFAYTGGVPKYVELLVENSDLSIEGMQHYMVRDNSPFIDEGKHLLIEEFGRDYGIYFSILSNIAAGINTQAAIENTLGGVSIGGHIKKLIEDYGLISRMRPILSKEGSQSVRYEICDNFLKFWFRYFDRNQSMVEIRNFELLRKIISDDYTTYTGTILERYFRLKMIESREYSAIGAWWERKRGKAANEIDIVAITADRKRAIVAEVKRQRRNYNHKEFMAKVDRIGETALRGYDITPRLLTLEDM